MADELKPCPFCGGEGHIDGTSWTTRDGKDQAWVTCKFCKTYGPSSTDAIAAWNRRTPDLASALIASEAARKMADERLAVAKLIARQGKDTIATVLLLEIAAALTAHERVVLTRDETSLGPRVMEFAAIFKEIDNG